MPGEETLPSVGERHAEAAGACVIGRNESVSLCDFASRGDVFNACGGSEAGGNEFATGERFHGRSEGVSLLPMVMERMRRLNPARDTMRTCPTIKRRSARETKK